MHTATQKGGKHEVFRSPVQAMAVDRGGTVLVKWSWHPRGHLLYADTTAGP